MEKLSRLSFSGRNSRLKANDIKSVVKPIIFPSRFSCHLARCYRYYHFCLLPFLPALSMECIMHIRTATTKTIHADAFQDKSDSKNKTPERRVVAVLCSGGWKKTEKQQQAKQR
jgi:hypothetical protein